MTVQKLLALCAVHNITVPPNHVKKYYVEVLNAYFNDTFIIKNWKTNRPLSDMRILNAKLQNFVIELMCKSRVYKKCYQSAKSQLKKNC